MKTLILEKGKSTKNFKCLNGDVYDSVCRLIDEWQNQVYYSEYANVDHTTGYKGGIAAPGKYYGIVGDRPDGKQVIAVFKHDTDISKIKSIRDLTEKMVTLISICPNPNHDGEFVVTFVQVHGGGKSWDFSHACWTLLNQGGIYDFDRLMDLLKDGEILEIELKW